MSEPLVVYLDLGDLLTKGIAVTGTQRKRFGFPSVIARRLLPKGGATADLLLGGEQDVPRMVGFEQSDHPRTRSFPGGEAFLGAIEPSRGARFAGWAAAAYGADREMLGRHASEENIDALVHKAFLMNATNHQEVELVFIVDAGPKAQAIQRYAERSPRTAEFTARGFKDSHERRVRLNVRCHVVDAAACVALVLPPEVSLDQVQRVLLIDIGYLRTKLVVLFRQGCERQLELDGVGVSNCVRRILRDEQENGLIEDEIAVVKALEQSRTMIEVAGRTFDIRTGLEESTRELVGELCRAAQRTLARTFERHGETCTAVAIIGGGAAIAGDALARRLAASDLGVETTWVSRDTRFLLAEGAGVNKSFE